MKRRRSILASLLVVELLRHLNHTVDEEGVSQGQPSIQSAIDAAEVVLTLAPETNGNVSVKAWDALGQITGRDHKHLAEPKHARSSPRPPGRAWRTST